MSNIMNKNLDSKCLTDEIYAEVKNKIQSSDKISSLAIILVGKKKDSMTYIKLKRKKCEELGIVTYLYSFSDRVSIDHIIKSIEAKDFDKRNNCQDSFNNIYNFVKENLHEVLEIILLRKNGETIKILSQLIALLVA